MLPETENQKHIIFRVSRGKNSYIGMTAVKEDSPQEALDRKFRGLISSARTESRAHWPLQALFNQHDPEKFHREILKTVAGKQKAMAVRAKLVAELRPTLNTNLGGKHKRIASE